MFTGHNKFYRGSNILCSQNNRLKSKAYFPHGWVNYMKTKIKNNNWNYFQTRRISSHKRTGQKHYGKNKQAILNSRVSSRKMSLSSRMETLQSLKFLFFGHPGVNITVEPHTSKQRCHYSQHCHVCLQIYKHCEPHYSWQSTGVGSKTFSNGVIYKIYCYITVVSANTSKKTLPKSTNPLKLLV